MIYVKNTLDHYVGDTVSVTITIRHRDEHLLPELQKAISNAVYNCVKYAVDDEDYSSHIHGNKVHQQIQETNSIRVNAQTGQKGGDE